MTTAEKLAKLTENLPEPLLVEILDFAEFLNQRHHAAISSSNTDPRPLSDLAGGLENSVLFTGHPAEIQKMMRDEWD
jgi:hypothetical protein